MSVEARERTELSSISGLGPNQRRRRLADQRPRSWRAAPAGEDPFDRAGDAVSGRVGVGNRAFESA